MLHPVGSLPASVYWRRRILVLAPFVLIGLTIYVAVSGGSGKQSAKPPVGATTTADGTSTAHRTTDATHSAATSTAATGTASTRSTPTTAAPAACAKSALKIAATTGAASYHVGDQPVLYLQVTNVGPAPCIADLSDPQIELLVYNGASRVWGSHDCLITPGKTPEMLPVGQPVRRSITWSGLSSQPNCAGTRQRVGPGTYTLHAKLSGVEGTTAQFTITQ